MAISVLILASRALAVENNGGFNATAPTNADIPGWTAGWPSVGTTGWDYVGQAGSASGVYMGNSWVLTAGHVGPHTFTLGETAYSPAANSAVGFQDSSGTIDLSAVPDHGNAQSRSSGHSDRRPNPVFGPPNG